MNGSGDLPAHNTATATIRQPIEVSIAERAHLSLSAADPSDRNLSARSAACLLPSELLIRRSAVSLVQRAIRTVWFAFKVKRLPAIVSDYAWTKVQRAVTREHCCAHLAASKE